MNFLNRQAVHWLKSELFAENKKIASPESEAFQGLKRRDAEINSAWTDNGKIPITNFAVLSLLRKWRVRYQLKKAES